ncbi:MAG: ROK family protein [Phycisphaerales bacterium]|nr:ROK family protein [Phycisphaerales bacterium]
MSDAALRIGIDLGGTKIAACALEGDREIGRRRVPTPQGDYAATVEALCSLVESLERDIGRTGTVGIGHPGSVSPRTGLHRNANSTCLNGHDLCGDIARRLGRDVRCANDADCLALSEAADGAGAGARCVFAVILGTGVGGGIVVDGRVISGPSRIGGEWGHNPMTGEPDAELRARPCYCGRCGCIEQFLSGPAIEAEYARTAGRALPLAGIAAQGTDPNARAAIDRMIGRLGRALAVVCNIVDPDAIVLGGGVSNMADLYTRLPDAIAAHVFGDAFATPVRQARFGDASGGRGAARLWDAPRGA